MSLLGTQELPLQGSEELGVKELSLESTQEPPVQGTGTKKLPLQQAQELPLQGTQDEKPKSPCAQSRDHLLHTKLPGLMFSNSVESESEPCVPEVSVLEASRSSTPVNTSSLFSDFPIKQETTVNSSVQPSAIVGKSPREEVFKVPVEIRRSPSLEAPELVISMSPATKALKLPAVEVTAKLPVVNNSVEVAKNDSENNQSSESIPVFVSQAPTGLTSPVALRPTIEGSPKKDFVAEDQLKYEVKDERPSNVAVDKNRLFVAPRHSSSPLRKRKKKQPKNAEYSLSIAERTRSKGGGSDQSVSSLLKKPAKREIRELNRLVVDMNGYENVPKSVQRKRKPINKFSKSIVKKSRNDIDDTGTYFLI